MRFWDPDPEKSSPMYVLDVSQGLCGALFVAIHVFQMAKTDDVYVIFFWQLPSVMSDRNQKKVLGEVKGIATDILWLGWKW